MYSSILIYLLLSLILITRAEDDNKSEEKILQYERPSVDDIAHFSEPFHDEGEFKSRWIFSQAKKEGVEEIISKYNGVWSIQEPKDNPIVGDNGLVLTSEAKHAAISAPLTKPFNFENKPLIVQYEVRFQNTHECGGAYIKLLAESPHLNLDSFGDKTLYSIMFGPDKCGGDAKLHFIFQHENPITHQMEEKHAKKGNGEFSNIFDDKKTHLVTLIVRPDNSFQVFVDKTVVNKGSLLTDMEPPVNPPKEIDDPEDVKPSDWDEREKIVDPSATKPDDWDEDAPKQIVDSSATKPEGWFDDEPEYIADPDAVRPADWDDEEDGEWEAPQVPNPKCKEVGCGEWKAPMIKNPDYKGKWTAPLVKNPDYKGVWSPRKIENPNYFEDLNPFAMKPIAAIGFELWSMQSDILFDNIIIADDESLVNQWTLQTWYLKHEKEAADTPSAVGGLWKSFVEATEDKPWLWVVAVVAILLPLVLIYIFCFSSSEDEPAVRKKTDAVVEDDPMEEKESLDSIAEDSEPEKQVENQDDGKDSEKEVEEIQEEGVKKAEGKEDGEDDDGAEDKKGDVEEEKDKQEEIDEEMPSPSPRTRARRKTRKD